MSYEIIVTEEAESSFNLNMNYLLQEWDDKTIEQFLERVDHVINEIRKNPFTFSLYEYRSNIRRSVINKRIILYYRVIEDTKIELLAFRNTRNNPENLKF